ncbi:MAG: TonB family protein [bacterium]
MDKTFKISLQISIAFHALLLISFSVKQTKIIKVPLYVDLVRYEPKVEKKEKKKKEDVALKEVKKKEKEEAIPKETVIEESKKIQPEPMAAQATSKIMLEDENFPFPYYLKVLQNRIAARWRWPANTGVLKAVAYFKVLREGRMTDIKIHESSGDYLFDQAALRAINLSQPMPSLPERYTENQLGVYFEFNFHE